MNLFVFTTPATKGDVKVYSSPLGPCQNPRADPLHPAGGLDANLALINDLAHASEWAAASMKAQISSHTDPKLTTAFIRWMVGFVFLSEGIQKWILPELRGAGRFEMIGLPWPEFLGYLVGTTEIVCGILLVIGLAVRLAAIPLLIIMAVALLTTKVPIFLEQGLWEAAHAARTDFCMTIGSLFILLRGAGGWSIDGMKGGG